MTSKYHELRPHTVWVSDGENPWEQYAPTLCWEDAGPIIANELIALKPVSLFVGGHRWFAYKGDGDFSIKHADNNPLRAAMIVFLMVQDSANVPANSTGSDIR